jgi:hypothetical protein
MTHSKQNLRFRFVQSIHRKEQGAVLVLVAFSFIVLMLLVGVVVDYGLKFRAQQQLQKQVDASALAGAIDLPSSAVAKQNAARLYALNISLTNPPAQETAASAPGSSANTTGYSISKDSVSVTTPYTKPSSLISPTNLIHVAASRNVDMIFARIIGINSVRVFAAATAVGCQCDLGYPFASSNPLTSVDFNESEVLRGFGPNIVSRGGTIKLWYEDEHAMTLGIRQIIVNGVVKNYDVTPLTANPSSATHVQVGATAMTGLWAGTDPAGRPIWPAMFVTDITRNSQSRDGDWQYDGTPIPPTAVFGTWKAAVKTVTTSKGNFTVSVLPDADPKPKNGLNLGPGSDPVPDDVRENSYKDKDGELDTYGAEVRWDVDDLIARGIFQRGHVYRVQFMVHDGDQNKGGGDVGQGCAIVGIDTDCGGGLRD